MRLYVGNLSYNTTEDGLRSAFGEHGQVTSIAIITDRDTGQSKGFAFIDMVDAAAGKAAIAGMDGKEVGGRQLKVNEARAREERSGGGGGGFRSGGGNRGGGRSGGGGGGRDRY